jgi:hypothetical protein
VAETNGLLNRRTGKSGTEGSNPSVSATHLNISKTCLESVDLPTFLDTFVQGLVADCLAPKCTPLPPKTYLT